MKQESNHGLNVTTGEGNVRVLLGCTRQRGLLYMVAAEKSWVCTEDMLPGHALAGFLGELTARGDSEVEEMMQRWGIYFRQMPLDESQG